MEPGREAYIRQKFSEAEIAPDPFPHLIIRDALPPALYDEMRGALPPRGQVSAALWRHELRRWFNAVRGLTLPSGDTSVGFYISETARFGRGLDDRSTEWQKRFGDYIDLIDELAHRTLGAHEWVAGQRIVFFRPTGCEVSVHVHGPQELLNLLLYFPNEKNTTEQGTALYRTLPNGDIELAKVAAYTDNTLVAWLNSPHSHHGSMNIAGGAARQYLYMNSSR